MTFQRFSKNISSLGCGWNVDGGNGFAFILPDRHGSQMESGACFNLISIPVMSCLEIMCLTEL